MLAFRHVPGGRAAASPKKNSSICLATSLLGFLLEGQQPVLVEDHLHALFPHLPGFRRDLFVDALAERAGPGRGVETGQFAASFTQYTMRRRFRHAIIDVPDAVTDRPVRILPERRASRSCAIMEPARTIMRRRGRRTCGLAARLSSSVVAVTSASAQYFGRNKVQYRTFEFQILQDRTLRPLLLPGRSRGGRRLAVAPGRALARAAVPLLQPRPARPAGGHPLRRRPRTSGRPTPSRASSAKARAASPRR